jgi:hypothetical protein
MERLERLTVQLAEAKRLAARGYVAHSRLALLLLDNAAETMLYHESHWILQLEAWRSKALARLQEVRESLEAPPPDLLDEIAELEAAVLSPKRIKEIEERFDAKVNLLVQRNVEGVSETIGRCLKKLHKYRNDTYHRDRIRPKTLKTAVDIYFYLCCKLLGEMPAHVMMVSGPMPPGLVEPLGQAVGLGLGASAVVSGWLLGNEDLESQQIQRALSDHMRERLDQFDEDLTWTAETLEDLSGASWLPSDVLNFIQIEDEDFAWPMSLEEIRKFPVPVSRKRLEGWRKRAGGLAGITPTIKAFAGFADLEDQFEKIENPLNILMTSIDAEIQHRIDVMRGK